MRWLTLGIFGLLIILASPVNALSFDNNGGGSWSEYFSFPLTATPTEDSQYKIVITGNTWNIYNASGGSEVSGTNADFWSLVNSNGSDIRVFNDTNAQLYFWIEAWDYINQSATIWVKISNGSTELNIAYGNSLATPSSYNNGSMVFEFFDDFEDGDASDWSFSGGTWVVDTNAAYHGSYGLDYQTASTSNSGEKPTPATIGRDIVIELAAQNYEGAGTQTHAISILDGSNNGYKFAFAFSVGTYASLISRLDAGSETILTDGGGNIGYNTWAYGRITLKSDGTIIFNDSVTDITTTDSTYGTFTKIKLTASRQGYFDFIRIYKLADPADFGSPIVKSLQKRFGTKTIYVNVTYLDTSTTTRYNPAAYYTLEDKPQINVTSQLSISGVNTTYGANISIELINFVNLDNVTYNNTDVTLNLTYQGTVTNTTTGYTYNVYNFTAYENGTLEVSGHVVNKAYNTTFKLDGDSVDIFNTTAIIGELLEINLPYTGNVTIENTTNANVSVVNINTKDLGVGVKSLSISIDDPENFTVGYKSGLFDVEYGRLNMSILHKDLSPFTNAVVSIFNENYSILSTDPSTLYAGNNTINIYFHGVKLKSTSIYLNHTNSGSNVTINVNSTKFADYRAINVTVASPNDFDLVNLSEDYPYSVMGIYNYSGTVVIDFGANPPTSVQVSGADTVNYANGVLKFTGSGNATITDLYKLSVNIKDRLGNPVNFYITINNSRVDASNGVATKLLKPSWYEVAVPAQVNGFSLWSFAGDSNTVKMLEINTTDASLSAEYRVPTSIETTEVKIKSMSWLPIPFLSPKQDENVTIVRLQGSIKDFYGSPVPNKNLTIEISSTKYTRIYNTTTDSSGNFKLDVDMAKGVEYSVKYSFAGDDVYVGSSTSKTFFVESLPSVVPPEISTLTIAVIAIAGIGAVIGAAYFIRTRTVTARTKVESDFRFFRKLK